MVYADRKQALSPTLKAGGWYDSERFADTGNSSMHRGNYSMNPGANAVNPNIPNQRIWNASVIGVRTIIALEKNGNTMKQFCAGALRSRVFMLAFGFFAVAALGFAAVEEHGGITAG